MRWLWQHVMTAILLIAAAIVAAAAGRAPEAAITGMLALLPIGFLALLVFAKRRGFVDDDR